MKLKFHGDSTDAEWAILAMTIHIEMMTIQMRRAAAAINKVTYEFRRMKAERGVTF